MNPPLDGGLQSTSVTSSRLALAEVVHGEQRLEGNTGGLEGFGGAFLAVDDGDDTVDDGAFGPKRLNGLHGGAAGGGHILEHDNALALKRFARGEALDELLRAVALGLLTDEEGRDRRSLHVAQRGDGGGERHGAHLEAAHQIDLGALQRVEDQQRDEMRALGV